MSISHGNRSLTSYISWHWVAYFYNIATKYVHLRGGLSTLMPYLNVLLFSSIAMSLWFIDHASGGVLWVHGFMGLVAYLFHTETQMVTESSFDHYGKVKYFLGASGHTHTIGKRFGHTYHCLIPCSQSTVIIAWTRLTFATPLVVEL